MSFSNYGWGAPVVPENPVVVSTSSSATGAPVYAATPSTPTSAVFNAIVGSPTVLVTAAPAGGGDISLQTINMVTTHTNQNITGRKTFSTLPPIIPTITADGINNITVPTTAGTMALTSQIPSVSSLVTGPGSAVSGNIATYNGTSGKLIQDSGVPITNVATKAGSETLTNKTIAYGSNTITGLPVSSTGYAAYYILNAVGIPNATETTVAFDTAIATDSGITNSPSGTFTINTTGIYTISATIAYVANATGYRFVYFKLNSSPIYYSEMMVPTGHATFNTCVHTVFTGRLTAGDVIKVITAQLSGGSLNIVGYNSYAGNNVSMVQFTRIS